MTDADKKLVEQGRAFVEGKSYSIGMVCGLVREMANRLEALSTVPTPDGWVLVPREPTEAIITAIRIAKKRGMLAEGIWKQAMLAAAPTPASEGPAIPAGMKPWAGGDSAPDDWDGGPVWLASDELLTLEPEDEPLDWTRCGGEGGCVEGWCIIAYTPTPEPVSEPSDSGWRDIASAPRVHGHMILSFNRHGVMDTICWNDSFGDEGGWDDGIYDSDVLYQELKYWQPLPTAPGHAA